MDIVYEITKYKKQGVFFKLVDGNNLEIEAPQELLTDELIGCIKKQKQGIIDFLKEMNNQVSIARSDIPQTIKKESYELSNAQRRLWVLDQFEENVIAYQMPAAFILEGTFKVDVFRQAYSFMVGRHESLRTVFFTESGEPRQKILENTDFDIEMIDLRNSYEVEKEAEILAEKILKIPFDLELGPLVRFSIIQLEDKKFLLLFNMHHIISDGWSMSIFISEFLTSYESFKEGLTPKLSPLRIHYKDYSVWHNNLLDSSDIDNQREYWFDKLSGELPILNLPADKSRPVVQTFNGRFAGFDLTEGISTALNDLCLANKASLFIVLHALVKVLFYRFTGQEDIILGSPIAGRSHEDLETQIGFYVNTLCFRDTIKGDRTFLEFLTSVKETCTDAFNNQDYPFDRLVEDLNIKKDMSRSPIFDVMLALQNNETAEVEFDGLNLSSYRMEKSNSKFELFIAFSENNGILSCGIEYNTDIYLEKRIGRMAESLKCLINSVLQNPNSKIKDLVIIPEDERNLLLNIFNDTKTDYPHEKTIVDLFEEQVKRTPNSIAVLFDCVELTYCELNEKANIVGHYLMDNYGIRPDDLVGTLLGRSEKMIIALLGILKSGAAYIPIDPEYPEDRIDYMLMDSCPKVVLGEGTGVSVDGIEILDMNEILLSGKGSTNPSIIGSPNNLAYVIYTSGSTGKPKGTLIEHKNVVRLLFNERFQFNFSDRDVWTISHSFCFDFSVWEMYGALLYGGKAIVVSKETARDPAKFGILLEKQKVTVLNQTPTAFNNLSEVVLNENPNLSVRYLIFGGEALHPSKLRFWRDTFTSCKLINMFGITETTVHVSYKEITELEIGNNISNLGKPIPTLSTYVLDSNQRLLPIGVPGELCVAGDGVCRGYLNREDLTAERFIVNPFNKNERLYRSGDSAYITELGELIYLGRIDNQVQLRGFRIELGEIEDALNQIDEVDSVVVVAKEDHHGEKNLAAYYSVKNDKFKMEEIQKNNVASWQEVFQNYYSDDSFVTNPEFDISGWLSSYTGKLIEPSQMMEWVDTTVNRIQFTDPQNIYEIGCGSGLLLYRLIPYCTSYCGTDYSEEIINKVERVVSSNDDVKNKINLLLKTADDFNGVAKKSFDTIVINSVAQYFPNIDYLSDVIDKSIRALEKGGVLFIGDLRNYKLLELFHTSINIYQEDQGLEIDKLKQKISKDMEQEAELLVSPEYFHYLKMHNSRITHVDIRYKKGEAHNEMTKFRYDVLLHIEKNISIENSSEIAFDKIDFDISKIPSILDKDDPDILYVTGVVNNRIERDYFEMIHLDDVNSKDELNNISIGAQSEGSCIDSIEFEKVSPPGYVVELLWNGMEQLYDVAYIKEKNIKGKFKGIIPNRDLEITIDDSVLNYANNPLKTTTGSFVLNKIKESLKQLLPEYMIPSYFIQLDEIPLTLNGKIDSKALPEIDGSFSSCVEFVAPRNKTEENVIRIWQEILAFDRIGVHDNFFELGGHSLSAMRVVSQIVKELEVDITLSDIFENRTVETLSSLIGNANKKEYKQIEMAERQESFELSNAQKRLWILDQLEENSIAYNMPSVFILEGEFHEEAFNKAYSYIVERHESLRTIFIPVEGNPRQRVLENPNFNINIVDLRNSSNKDLRAEEIISSDLETAFDLSKGPLVRFCLIRLEDEKYLILFNMHHIVSDGWSMNILTKDFLRAYNSFRKNQKVDQEPLRIHYKDYSVWQNELLEGEEIKSQKEYWLAKLSGELPVLNLPTEKSRPLKQTFNGDRIEFILSNDMQYKLNDLCTNLHISLFMLLQGLVKVLLHKYTGQQDLIIGSPIAGRIHRDLENQIGFYLNNILLRDWIEPEYGVYDFMKRSAVTCKEAFDNQLYPYDKIVEDLDIKRDPSRNPIFDVLVVLQNNESTNLEFDGLTVLPYMEGCKKEASKFDITFEFKETANGLYCALRYNTDIYSRDRIERMGMHFETLISSVLEEPESKIKDLNILPADERNLLLDQFNSTYVDYPDNKSIVDLFEEQVENTPDNIAVIYKEIQLTYRELNEKANSVANYLLDKHDVSPDDFIGVLLHRSEKMIIALLGILKTGAAYVPVEVDYPEERRKYIIEDSDPKVIIGESNGNNHIDIIDILKSGSDTKNSGISINPESTLYVLYTSGTTGKPKGIMTKHENVANFVYWGRDYFFDKEIEGNFALFSSISFDFTSTPLYLSLLRGKKLTIFDQRDDMNEILFRIFKNSNVDSVKLTPSHISLLQDLEVTDTKMKLVISGGEELFEKHVDILRKTSSEKFMIVNAYGPTESTMTCIVKTIDDDQKIVIGKPMANVKIHIMDNNSLKGIGIPGEICISGAGISKGYLNRDGLTSEKFVENPFLPGEKMYRTGDLGQWFSDGNVGFLGRIDDQIKIRGFRIEPCEIERVLTENGSIDSAVVSFNKNADGENELVAYYVSHRELTISELREYVTQYLPVYMVPPYFVPLESIPMTINGKVDKRSLPDPLSNSLSTGSIFEAPYNKNQEILLGIWQVILGKDKISVNDKFFELGGDSIKLIKLAHAIKEEFGCEFKIVELFQYTTIKEISDYIYEINMNTQESVMSFSL